jgi:phage tail-like protein
MSDTKLLDFLPPAWRQNAIAKGIAQAAGQPFDYWRSVLTTVRAYLDPDSAPADWLDWLMAVTGHVPNEGLSDQRKRNLIRRAGEIWLKKGTAAGIEAYAQALTGVSAAVVESSASAFIAGVSKAGDVVGPGGAGWEFDVQVPTGSISEAELRDLLAPVVPAFCTYTVTFT